MKLQTKASLRWHEHDDIDPNWRRPADVLHIEAQVSLNERVADLVHVRLLVDGKPDCALWHRPNAEGARRCIANVVAVARLRRARSVRITIAAAEPAAEPFAQSCWAALAAMAGQRQTKPKSGGMRAKISESIEHARLRRHSAEAMV
ncbi:hypothetical protein [Cupriavidus taiwanensis]|uniref:Uncharacterized protein n=1 Tax=Cupriavidus taiwanensis TaxID=164546 RepID=A0A975X3N8_9BURK|nr:hypothetical protein CBM2587_A80008 [Cupriavidus taiwanensis]